VKLSRDVGGRHHDGKGLFALIDRGGEIALFAPVFIDAFLELAGGVGLGELIIIIHSETSK
jgi:hypothetical protein